MSASDDAVRRQRLFLAVALLAVFVMPISISGTAIALPAISDDLGDSATALQWVINGFNVAFALFVLVWGVASDHVGYRTTFLLGLVIMLAASILSAVASTLLMLDVARVLAGAGGSAIATGASALLSNTFTGAARNRAFALFGATLGLGLALGPTISGGLVALVGWRGVFGLVGLVPAVALLGHRLVPDVEIVPDPDRKAVDFSLLRNRRFLAIVLVPVACAVGYVTVLSYLPVALSAVHGMSAGTAGLVMLPMTVPVLAGPIIASVLIARIPKIGAMTVINAALILLCLGDVGLLLFAPQTTLWALVVPMILLGFGFGLPIGLVDGEALTAVPPDRSGTAAGVLNFMRLGSEAVVVGAYAAVLAALLRSHLAAPTAAAVAAGAPGHGGTYATQLHLIVMAMVVLTALLGIVINLLHRRPDAARSMSVAATADDQGVGAVRR
ncbi:MFS transporter [Conexibacter sp. CPCC 206217]|uniref:MFS transporter n=1 Tax=Conexibacter sp. CPCC 206217 TaxID=3064574 RepID=UPI0027194E58|nr:MFS transporter [Conexibacter sp. CPCC 206217]MDO8209611.1 MFS transporter [Conexibacter sp. CPCC 206217]